MRSIRVYGTIDTVKNLYNDFIILQDVFFLQVIFTFHVEFGITYMVLIRSYHLIRCDQVESKTVVYGSMFMELFS